MLLRDARVAQRQEARVEGAGERGEDALDELELARRAAWEEALDGLDGAGEVGEDGGEVGCVVGCGGSGGVLVGGLLHGVLVGDGLREVLLGGRVGG